MMAKSNSPKQPKPKAPRPQPGAPKKDPDEIIYDDPEPAEGEEDEEDEPDPPGGIRPNKPPIIP